MRLSNIIIDSKSDDNACGIYLRHGGSNKFLIKLNGNSDLVLRNMAQSQDTIVLPTGGNVGIGTSSPGTEGQLLEVAGMIGGRALVITDPGTSTLTNAQSGAFIPLTDDGRAYKLPTPALGLTYTFILTENLGNAATITSTTDGSTASNLFTGILNNAGTSTQKIDLDVITFVNGSAKQGDVVKVTCISTTTTSGNPTWFFEAHCSTSGGITA